MKAYRCMKNMDRTLMVWAFVVRDEPILSQVVDKCMISVEMDAHRRRHKNAAAMEEAIAPSKQEAAKNEPPASSTSRPEPSGSSQLGAPPAAAVPPDSSDLYVVFDRHPTEDAKGKGKVP